MENYRLGYSTQKVGITQRVYTYVLSKIQAVRYGKDRNTIIMLVIFLGLSTCALTISILARKKILELDEKNRDLNEKMLIQQNTITGQQMYIGCYTNFTELNGNRFYLIRSVTQCMDICWNKATLYAAMKDGSTCYCGNILNTRVPSSNCNLPCIDNSGTCGGNNQYAVYIGVPTYLGCVKDFPINSDMIEKVNGSLTIAKCYEKAGNHLFIGLRGGDVCYLLFQYGKYGKVSELDCDTKCTGNRNEMCGGNNRNSVYSVRFIDGLNKNYADVFHCLNGKTDMNGTCIEQTCKPGWKGSKCNQRDCTTNNGNCGTDMCTELNIGNQDISECLCDKGYHSDSIYDTCTDINECDLNPCDETSTCSNTIGSYTCICKDGYVYDPSVGCIVFNECDSRPCNETVSDCQNLIGSHECICKEGLPKTIACGMICKARDGQCSSDNFITPDRKIIIILAIFWCCYNIYIANVLL